MPYHQPTLMRLMRKRRRDERSRFWERLYRPWLTLKSTRHRCGPYCWRAKRLLDGKKIQYTEINLWAESGRRSEMVERASGRTSVPQIFIDGAAIGGSDELVALEQEGKLDELLKPTG